LGNLVTSPNRTAPDIVGIGALNIDYIATATQLSRSTAEKVTESTARFEWNTEGLVSANYIDEVIDQLGSTALNASFGGSAWNTLSALADLQTDVTLGYFGVLGREEALGLSFIARMDAAEIDSSHVVIRRDVRSGICLSFIDDGERILLTHPGANSLMAKVIADDLEESARYLATARVIHVTSFLDDYTPGALADLLEAALAHNPEIIVSFDPGHEWASKPTPDVLRILALSSVLFLNYREFKALAEYTHGEGDAAMGDRLSRKCAADSRIFVTKRYDLVEVFSKGAAEVVRDSYSYDFADPDKEIEDATGAGDVFAAAILASMISADVQVELGAYLGLTLARHKLRHHASSGHRRFPDLTRGFFQSRDFEARVAPTRGSVILAHDGNPQSEKVESFLRRLGITPKVVSLAVSDPAGQSLAQGSTDDHSFAICILSNSADDAARANDRLVYYAGVMQGMFGFAKVAVIMENGVTPFSNMAGLVRLDFRPGHIDSCFLDLEQMLYREGVI
jgi:sugar/nucleoside kinase (ribokinase family)